MTKGQWAKIGMAVAGLLAAIIVTFALIISHIAGGLCEDTLLSRQDVGDGVELCVYDRGCGATVGFITLVTLRRKSDDKTNVGEKVLLMDGQPEVTALARLNGEIKVTIRMGGGRIHFQNNGALGRRLIFQRS